MRRRSPFPESSYDNGVGLETNQVSNSATRESLGRCSNEQGDEAERRIMTRRHDNE